MDILVGENLKKIRKLKNLSLDQTAKLTSVSKAMLGQIERGESNPTISTLWKISTGLKTSLSSLIDESNKDLSVVDIKNVSPIQEYNGDMCLYSIFPFNVKTGFEILLIELKNGCCHLSPPHDEGVEEYITVLEGELELRIRNEALILTKGQSIRFNATTEHSYKNKSKQKTIFHNTIFYSPTRF